MLRCVRWLRNNQRAYTYRSRGFEDHAQSPRGGAVYSGYDGAGFQFEKAHRRTGTVVVRRLIRDVSASDAGGDARAGSAGGTGRGEVGARP